MRDLKQPIFIKSDKITKKSLDFYFYFHIYCHRHHRQMNLRIWCSWCSIADFSSVCTGSSPVIRYLHYIVRYRCLQILFSDCYCVVWGFRFVTTLLSLWESLVEMYEQREILGERKFWLFWLGSLLWYLVCLWCSECIRLQILLIVLVRDLLQDSFLGS